MSTKKYIIILKINMTEENIIQEFRLKEIDVRSKKHKKVCKILNYAEHLHILASTVIGCVSSSAFVLLVGVSAGIPSSAVEIKTCAITAV